MLAAKFIALLGSAGIPVLSAEVGWEAGWLAIHLENNYTAVQGERDNTHCAESKVTL